MSQWQLSGLIGEKHRRMLRDDPDGMPEAERRVMRRQARHRIRQMHEDIPLLDEAGVGVLIDELLQMLEQTVK